MSLVSLNYGDVFMSGAGIMILIIVIISIVFCAVMAILGGVAGSKRYFVCRNCGQIFKPKWTQMCFNAHVFDEHMLKCPHCKVKDFCGDKGKNYKYEH